MPTEDLMLTKLEAATILATIGQQYHNEGSVLEAADPEKANLYLLVAHACKVALRELVPELYARAMQESEVNPNAN